MGRQKRTRHNNARSGAIGFDIDDDVDGTRPTVRPMSVEDVMRDDAIVPETMVELTQQVLPFPPPLPPSKPRLEPPDSFIRTRVSKKEKQNGKRDQFVHMIARAAATRARNAAMMADDEEAAEAPELPTGTASLVDDFLSAVGELAANSNDASGAAPAAAGPAKLRTDSQRARVQLKEQNQFKAVLQHEAFKSDPLGTLQEHLANRIRLEQEQKARQAASLDSLAAHDVQASKRLHRAIQKNKRAQK